MRRGGGRDGSKGEGGEGKRREGSRGKSRGEGRGGEGKGVRFFFSADLATLILRLAFIRSTQEELTGNFILGTFAMGRVVS